jgi:hypothetical protein
MTPEQIRSRSGRRGRAHRTHAPSPEIRALAASDRRVAVALLHGYRFYRAMEFRTGQTDVQARHEWARKADRTLDDLEALLTEGRRP